MKIKQTMSEFQLALAQKEIAEDVLGVKHVVNTSRKALNDFNKKLGKELHVKTTDNPTLTNIIKDVKKMKKSVRNYGPNTSLWYKIDGTTLYIRGHEAEGYSEIMLHEDVDIKWPDVQIATITEAVIEETIAPISCKSMFLEFSELQNVQNAKNIQMHYCTTLLSMFSKCSKLTSVDCSEWDVCNVKVMRTTFLNTSIRTLDLSKWNTRSLQNAYAMFNNCGLLESVGNLKDWNTSNVSLFKYMFNNCIKLNYVGELDNWNVRNATEMLYMFHGCCALTNIGNICKWNAPYCSNFTGMFMNYDNNNVQIASGITMLDVSSLLINHKVDVVLNLMFCGASNLKEVGDLSKWNVSNVTKMRYMFYDCCLLTDVGDLHNWNAPKCIDARFMFCGYYVDKMLFKKLDVKNLFKNGIIETVSGMFLKCVDLEYLDISNWNVSNLEDAGYMINPLLPSKLKHIGDLSNWDLSSLKSCVQMFMFNPNLTSIGSTKNWNISNVTDMTRMFNCTPVNGLDMKNWDTSKCTNMYEAFGNFNSYQEFGEGISYIKSLCPIHKGTNTAYAFWYNRNLTTIEDSGTISESVNFAYSPLTHDSALVLINALDAENPGTLTLSTETYATLTDEDKAIATAKGWTIAA